MHKVAQIMVVDDIASNIDILLRILDRDYEVRVALDGPSALEDMAAEPPDLVLLDVMMPGMDGYEVCSRMKSHERLNRVPVIFITAKEDFQDEVKGFDAGAVDYITKPVSPPVVLARVATHLSLVKARQTLEDKNLVLEENARLREEMDKISRHDLKTPLNKIISLPGIMLQDQELAPKHVSSLKTIEEAGFTMLNMINRSLDMVKMELGTYRMVVEAVDLRRVVNRVISDLDSLSAAKGISIQIEPPGNQPFLVSGEKLLCYSMAANLIKNAIEACPDNSLIRIFLAKSQNGEATFTVENQGLVPESLQDRFFDKYTTAGKEGGTGLGTYSARLMAQTMGGSISMTTSKEKGTRIQVDLKPSDNALSTEEPTVAQKEVCHELPQKMPSLNLMIVDDDPDNLTILEQHLFHPALKMEKASNGKEAIEKWERLGHELIFMDIEMPVMNGIQAIKAIRDMDGGEKVTIAALPAHEGHDTASLLSEADFDAVLSKPVSRNQLYGVILSCLNQVTKPNDGCAQGPTRPKEEASGMVTVTVDKELEDIFPQFLANKASQIDRLNDQIRAQDFQGIRQSAHKLKGGFYMYGLNTLGELCADLEKLAAANDNAGIPELGHQVAERFNRLNIQFD